MNNKKATAAGEWCSKICCSKSLLHLAMMIFCLICAWNFANAQSPDDCDSDFMYFGGIF
jgi:hypothetical protein